MTSYTDTYTDEDEQQDASSMSFLDHLDELRTRLIRSTLFVLAAFAICWAFSDKIYNFLEIPVRAAMNDAIRRTASNFSAELRSLVDYADGTQVTFTFPATAKVRDTVIPAGATTVVVLQRAADGVPELVLPAPWALNQISVIPEGTIIPRELYSSTRTFLDDENRLVTPTVQGAFNLYIKVSFYAAIFFAVPFLLVQIWGFVSPGLYPHEKKYAVPFITMTSLFFMLGTAFAYFIAFPRAANFLLGVAAEGNLRPLVSADEYFDLIITIMLGLGLVFEIPTVTLFLSRLGLVTPQLLLRVWRFALIIIFIVAAILSPTTDIPNLLVFAAPMIILYALSVGIAWIFYRKRRTEA